MFFLACIHPSLSLAKRCPSWTGTPRTPHGPCPETLGEGVALAIIRVSASSAPGVAAHTRDVAMPFTCIPEIHNTTRASLSDRFATVHVPCVVMDLYQAGKLVQPMTASLRPLLGVEQVATR
jgi:hypothetical protein